MHQIFHGGRVYTGDESMPNAQGFVIEDGRLIAVGTDDEVLAQRRPDSQITHLGGAFVMPGFVDVHLHPFLSGREELFELNFPIGANVDEIIESVAGYIASGAVEPGAWVVGSPWASDLLEQVNTPASLAKLDAVSGDHPVVLTDDSHHDRWVNSLAMELAGITDNVTGVLVEKAVLPISKLLAEESPLTPEQEKAAYKRGIEVANSYGITAFQDAAVSKQIMRAVHSLDTAGELGSWVVSSMTINDETLGFDPIGDELVFDGEQFRSRHHRPDFVKIFLDGVPPTRTGAFIEPYLPDDLHGHHHRGQTLFDPAELVDWLRRVAKVGLSAKIHCTGDASVHAVLNAVEVLRAEGFTETRYQVAHGQFVLPSDIPRFAQLGVDADISPFIWTPGPIPEAIKLVLPAERASQMQPNRALLDSGALLATGSDWPVAPIPNPWVGIEGLVTRQDPSGQYPGSLWPEQAITLTEAIATYTSACAKSMGLESECGSLSVGKSADFIILDRDPFAIDPSDLAEVRVEETWFAGRRVFGG